MNKNTNAKIAETPLVTVITGYLAAIAVSVAFALYMSASVGWTFVYFFVSAPLFSLAVTAALKLYGCISVKVECDKTMVYKGEEIKVRISASNKSILPVPALIVELIKPVGMKLCKISDGANGSNCSNCSNFSDKDLKGIAALSIMPKGTTVFEATYRAEMWGSCTLGVTKSRLQDFMRFFTFKISDGIFTRISVFPNIPDVPSDMPLIRAVTNEIRLCSDSEETTETDAAMPFAGMPGYTHREYQPGDPIKRINWKLSSKRDIYMVRLDDEIETMEQTILLDCVGSNAAENERAVEGTIAVAYSLLRLGFKSNVWFRTKNGYADIEISDYGNIVELQTALASYVFENETVFKEARINDCVVSNASGSGVLLVTPYISRQLAAEIGVLEAVGTKVTAVSASKLFEAAVSSIWVLADDYSAEMISS